MMVRIAASLARCDPASRTCWCSEALPLQDGEDASGEVVLFEAGSTAGAADQLRARFPSAVVSRKGPDLFLDSDMRRGFEYAVCAGYRFASPRSHRDASRADLLDRLCRCTSWDPFGRHLLIWARAYVKGR